MKKRLLEMAGMVLIGDGVLTLLDPERHCLLWEVGPKAWRDLLDEFAEHPALSRVAGAVEAAVGICLAQQQEPSVARRLGLR